MEWRLKEIIRDFIVKIEFGCGETLTPGFVGCDIRKLPGVEYVCNSWEIRNYVEDNSVEEIYSRHFMEHLTFTEVEETMKAWYYILTARGKLRIIVPDMDFHIKQWQNPNRETTINPNGMTDLEWACAGFWGHQRETEEGLVWDIHKSGWNFDLLNTYLKWFGFTNIKRVNDLPKNLHVVAQVI